jgi:hypothetical protein
MRVGSERVVQIMGKLSNQGGESFDAWGVRQDAPSKKNNIGDPRGAADVKTG